MVAHKKTQICEKNHCFQITYGIIWKITRDPLGAFDEGV